MVSSGFFIFLLAFKMHAMHLGAILSVPITCVFRLWLGELDDHRAKRVYSHLALIQLVVVSWDILGFIQQHCAVGTAMQQTTSKGVRL